MDSFSQGGANAYPGLGGWPRIVGMNGRAGLRSRFFPGTQPRATLSMYSWTPSYSIPDKEVGDHPQ